MLIVLVADNEDMTALLLFILSLAVLIGMGLLAVYYGADSRPTDPRDLRHSWH